ncbi:MAG: PspC domain-containing protein [Dermatophilaceae bacterium]
MTQNPTAPAGAPQPAGGYGADAGGRSPVDELFGWIRTGSVQRDTERRWFGGVCAGVARRFDVDPVLVRAVAIVLAFLGGVGITLYLVLWLLLPDRDGAILAQRATRGEILPLLLLLVTGLALFGSLTSVDNGVGWFTPLWFVAGGILVWYLVDRGRRDGRRDARPPAAAEPPAATAGQAAGWPSGAAQPDAVPSTAPGGPAAAPGGPAADASSSPPSSPARGAPVSASGTTHPVGAVPPVTSPTSSAPVPYGAPSVPYGSAPAPYGSASAPYGSASAPYGSPPAPYGSPPAPYGSGGSRPPGSSGPGGPPFGPQRPIVPPPPPAPKRRRPSWSIGLVSLGLAVALVGLGVALDETIGFPSSAAVLGLVMALGAVSLVVVVLGLTGRASGFSGFLVIMLALALAGAAAASNVDIDVDDDPTNDRQWRPSQGAGPFAYELSTGEARLDLGGLDPVPSDISTPQLVEATVAAGRLTIVVPAGLTVSVESTVGLGEITVEDATGTGNDREMYGPGGGGTDIFGVDDQVVDVEVTADVGLGDIVIEER